MSPVRVTKFSTPGAGEGLVVPYPPCDPASLRLVTIPLVERYVDALRGSDGPCSGEVGYAWEEIFEGGNGIEGR